MKREDQPWPPIDILLRYIPHQLNSLLCKERAADLKLYHEQHEAAWKWITEETRSLSTHRYLCRIPPFAKLLQHFDSALKPLASAVKRHYATLPPEQSAVGISKFLSKLPHWLAQRRTEIEMISSALKDTIGNLEMCDYGEIKQWALASGKKCSKIFILKMDYVKDRVMEDIKSWTRHPEEAFKLPFFQLFHEETEYQKEIHKKLRKFSSVAHINPQNAYFIGMVPSTSQIKDGVIANLTPANLKNDGILSNQQDQGEL